MNPLLQRADGMQIFLLNTKFAAVNRGVIFYGQLRNMRSTKKIT